MTNSTVPGIGCRVFGRLPSGETVKLYTLTNASGLSLDVMDYGTIITRLHTPDRDGNFDDIVLGFETLEEYLRGGPYLGALVGRFANRIAKGQFTLDGETYTLAQNNGPNHLHGGIEGFDKKMWVASHELTDDGLLIVFERTSPDGEEGYPGNLVVTVSYLLSRENELVIDYRAHTDRATPVSLTHHGYFNLSGGRDQDILDHELMVNADAITPVDENLIPTGEILPVKDTPFDFRSSKKVGRDIDSGHPQIERAGGFDHNFVLNGGERPAARLCHKETGRVVEVFTDAPGIQFYSGNFLDGTLSGKGIQYTKRSGLCLETQQFPDSPNQPGFPSSVLRPGEVYATRTRYRFATQ